MDGIRINAKCQALREDGTVIEGLYVTGNDSGCYFDRSYINQATGAAAGRTVVPSCSFVADWIAHHPGYERLVQP